MSEDEYLEISDIKRDQSGEYECSALNDVAAPDVRKVKITVNCELTIVRASRGGDGGGATGDKLVMAMPFSDRPSCLHQENT